VTEAPLAQSGSGLLGGLISSIVTDDNIKMFHKITDEFGKTIGQHQVTHRPSIGRVDRQIALQEPKARESLLGPSLKEKSGSMTFNSATRSQAPPQALSSSEFLSPMPNDPAKQSPVTPKSKLVSVYQAAAVMERTPFAIDDPHDEYSDEDEGAPGDDNMLDEVDAFLEENDSGLTAADKALHKDLLTAPPIK